MNYRKLIFTCFLLLCWTVVLPAQSAEKPLSKNALSNIAARKGQIGPFVLLTPADLNGRLLEAIGDPCSEAAPISFGQTINGTLTSSDCRLDDDSFADFYFFSGTQGQQVTINLASGTFDTYLGLANETGTFVLEDDDGGGGTNSRIVATLPATGTYIILANSAFPNVQGGYSLTLNGTTACTYSINPTSAQIPGLGATHTFSVVTQQDCQWGAVAQDSFITVNTPSGRGPATISYSVGNNPGGPPRTGTITVGGQVFTVTQASINCTYAITPTSADVPASGGTFEFMMNTPAGCPWSAFYNDYWVWTTNDVHVGPGPAVYTVAPNNASDRTGTISVMGMTFTVRQPGRACTYAVSPTSMTLSSARFEGDFTIDTQPGCTWNFSGAFNNVYFPDGYGGTGPGVKHFIVWPNNQFATRTWVLQFIGVATVNINFTQRGIPFRTGFDFFGDSKADLSVFRPSTGQWVLHDSQFNGVYTYSFGLAGDVLVPGDYDGDRNTEIAVFRPGNGTWYIYDRAANTYAAVQFGAQGDIPVPADYDGDGKTDIGIFRPSTSVWYIRRSGDGGYTITQFGVSTDSPVPADYDGDQKADIAIWRASAGEWWIARSSDGQINAAQFGNSTDKAVPGDYTGDGKVDVAIWRPSNGFWYVLRSEDYSYFAFPFGTDGDLPAPGDYDSDGVTDTAVFRPSNATWYINRTGSTVMTVPFGVSGDLPVPGSFVR